ncbi:MAG TPA: hypothetical protein VFY29_17515 [Terriglobia bacterium]|nr:hypothetical protein [Terriglobia bacterium]
MIRQQPDGEFLYGASMRGQTVVKVALDGRVLMSIDAAALVPDRYKARNARSGQLAMLLTAVDVAPNGDLYVTDGYASDFIHRFDREDKYFASFDGKEAPYSFTTLHKIAIDKSFDPPRIIGVDRANNRVVHMALDGKFLGVVAEGLLLPAAVAIRGDQAIIGELPGRVTILDKGGKVVAHVGANTGEGVGSNQLPPDKWVPDCWCRRTASPSTRMATSSFPSSNHSETSGGHRPPLQSRRDARMLPFYKAVFKPPRSN